MVFLVLCVLCGLGACPTLFVSPQGLRLELGRSGCPQSSKSFQSKRYNLEGVGVRGCAPWSQSASASQLSDHNLLARPFWNPMLSFMKMGPALSLLVGVRVTEPDSQWPGTGRELQNLGGRDGLRHPWHFKLPWRRQGRWVSLGALWAPSLH